MTRIDQAETLSPGTVLNRGWRAMQYSVVVSITLPPLLGIATQVSQVYVLALLACAAIVLPAVILLLRQYPRVMVLEDGFEFGSRYVPFSAITTIESHNGTSCVVHYGYHGVAARAYIASLRHLNAVRPFVESVRALLNPTVSEALAEVKT